MLVKATPDYDVAPPSSFPAAPRLTLCALAHRFVVTINKGAHAVGALLAVVEHPLVPLAVEPACVLGVLEVELLVDEVGG